MLVLLFSLFASQDAIEFGHTVENTFDVTRCTSYFLGQPLFPINQTPRTTEHVVTLYVPHAFWSADRYQWKIEVPIHETLDCFVITKGYDGKQLFFNALRAGQLDGWDKIEKGNLPQASFYGYKHRESETFALIGSYTELSPNPLIGEKFSVCGVGAPYAKEKERAVQDVEARQTWQRTLGKGSVVVVYPVGGIPYGSSGFTAAI